MSSLDNLVGKDVVVRWTSLKPVSMGSRVTVLAVDRPMIKLQNFHTKYALWVNLNTIQIIGEL